MSAMTLPTDEDRRTVPLHGEGWRVAALGDYRLVEVVLARPHESVLRLVAPDTARAIAAALTAAADEIEQRS